MRQAVNQKRLDEAAADAAICLNCGADSKPNQACKQCGRNHVYTIAQIRNIILHAVRH